MSTIYGGTTIPGCQTYGAGNLGVTGAVIQASTATGDNGPGVFYNDVMLDPSGNAAVEFSPQLTATPSAGLFTLYQDGSFAFSGAPNGSYTFKYMPKANGVAYAAEQTVSLVVGTATVTVDFSNTFVLRNTLSSDLAAAYSLRNVVSADTAAGFTIRATVTANLAGAYTLRSQVQSDLAGAYLMRNTVVTDLVGTYFVATAVSTVTADFVATYKLYTGVQVDLNGSYTVMQQVVRNQSCSYKVGDGVAVRPASISYNVGPESRTVMIVEGMEQPFFPMVPGSTLDFSFNWTDWLGGANIASATVTTEFYLSASEVAFDDKAVTLLATLSEAAPISMGTRVRCTITTDEVPARSDTRTIRLRAADR